MNSTLRNFNTFLNEKEDSLRELNEAFEPKDQMRIEDILIKSDGNVAKAVSLATTMANRITDADKAIRRAEAAENLKAPALAQIFYKRAEDLGADVNVDISKLKNEIPSEIPAETTSQASDAENQPETKKERKKIERSIKPGEFIKISAKNILDGSVGIIPKGSSGWRWLGSSSYSDGLSITSGKGYASVSSTAIENKGNDAVMYVEVTQSGAQWVEGKALFFCGIGFPSFEVKIRIKKKQLTPNGPELEFFLKEKEAIKNFRMGMFSGGSPVNYFLMGDESFVTDKFGESIDDLVPSSYRVFSLNSKLTAKEGTLVVDIVKSQSSIKENEIISAPYKDLATLSPKLTKEQEDTLADFIAKQIGGVVTAERSPYSSNVTFRIPWFIVKGSKEKGFLSEYRASPFFSESLAQEHIQELKEKAKKMKLPYSVQNLKIEECDKYNKYSVSFDQLMDYAKAAGIEIKLRKFIEQKRGAIVGKEFGF